MKKRRGKGGKNIINKRVNQATTKNNLKQKQKKLLVVNSSRTDDVELHKLTHLGHSRHLQRGKEKGHKEKRI